MQHPVTVGSAPLAASDSQAGNREGTGTGLQKQEALELKSQLQSMLWDDVAKWSARSLLALGARS